MNGLYKSKDNAVVFGVLGGLGEYFNVDPVLLRVIVVLLSFMTTGFPIILYIILAFIIPQEPDDQVKKKREKRFKDFNRKYKGETNQRKEAEDVEVEDEEDQDEWSDF